MKESENIKGVVGFLRLLIQGNGSNQIPLIHKGNIAVRTVSTKKDGFNLLYCSNDESEERKMAIVNIVMVKEQRVVSKEMGIDRTYTIFKPFKYRVLPSYLNKTSKEKYMEEISTPIVVNHDILN